MHRVAPVRSCRSTNVLLYFALDALRQAELKDQVRLLRPGRETVYCDRFVCLSVCRSVREHICGSAGPIFTKFCTRRGDTVSESDVYECLLDNWQEAFQCCTIEIQMLDLRSQNDRCCQLSLLHIKTKWCV